jgi:hypothetical protein
MEMSHQRPPDPFDEELISIAVTTPKRIASFPPSALQMAVYPFVVFSLKTHSFTPPTFDKKTKAPTLSGFRKEAGHSLPQR